MGNGGKSNLPGRSPSVLSGQGLARGIDSVAHVNSLEGGGRTMHHGCGLSYMYPPENRRLAERITTRGRWCREFPMTTKPDRLNSRCGIAIISGLSLGTVVVEPESAAGR